MKKLAVNGSSPNVMTRDVASKIANFGTIYGLSETGRTRSDRPNLQNIGRQRELFANKVQFGNANHARRLVSVLRELGFRLRIEQHGHGPLRKTFVVPDTGAKWWEVLFVMALREAQPLPVPRIQLARRAGILFGGVDGIDTVASLAPEGRAEHAFLAMLEEHA